MDKQSTSFSIGNYAINDDFGFIFVVDNDGEIRKSEIYSNISESIKKYLDERRINCVCITV